MSVFDFELTPTVESPVDIKPLDPRDTGPHQSVEEAMAQLQLDIWLEDMKNSGPSAGQISALLNFVPVLGQVKGVIEAILQEDLITGRPLEWWEIGLNLASAIPLAYSAKAALTAVEELGYTARVVRLGGHTVEAAHEGSRLGHAAHKLGHAAHGANMGVHGDHAIDEFTGGHGGGDHKGGDHKSEGGGH